MSDIQTKYGEKINLGDAQEMLNEYDFLRSHIEMKLKDELRAASPETLEKANVFMEMTQDFNAFVFTKELIMRFFDGSEEDKEGNPQASNFLLVILGAHKKDKTVNNETYKAGSFTVLTVGCTRKREVGSDGKTVIKFFPLSTPLPANEYPPQTRVKLKTTGSHGLEGNRNEHFEVS